MQHHVKILQIVAVGLVGGFFPNSGATAGQLHSFDLVSRKSTLQGCCEF